MKFKVVLTWNGTVVLDAICTAAMAQNISYNFLQDNFGKHGGMVCRVETLIEMEVGDCFRTSYFDSTGNAKIVIVKMEV